MFIYRSHHHLFFCCCFYFGEMCWWDSVSSVLYFCLNYQEHKWHFVNSQSEFISAHFTSSGKTLTAESATTMGKGKFNKCWLEHPEFSWLKAVLTNESEAQCTLCQRTLNFDALGVKALVSHTKSEKHQLASKSLQQSHTITHFCTPPSPVPGCPVLLDLNSAPPLLSHSQVTFKPS